MYCPTIQKDLAKRICKDCGTYFPSHAAVKRHRKGNGCSSLVVVDGNMSENKEEENVEFEGEETQPSVSKTAPILNTFEILAEVPFIDDDSCYDDEYQNKEYSAFLNNFYIFQ